MGALGMAQDRKRSKHIALRVALIYAAFAALWIVLSDQFMAWTLNEFSFLPMQTFKGLLFVSVTGVLVYVLVMRFLRRLDASETRYRAYIDHSPAGVLIVDGAGRIEEANRSACEMLHRAQQHLIGRSFLELEAPVSEGKCRAILEELKARGESESELVLAGGDDRQVRVILLAVPTDESKYLLYCVDVSDRSALQEQLIRAQRMEAVGQLAGGIAHDFNNLSQVVNGNIEIALMDIDPEQDPEMADALDQAADAGRKATGLVRQLLTFSRRTPLEPHDLDLNDVVENMSRILTRVLGRNIELHVATCDTPLMIHGDESMMEQVIMNLAVNARDAMPHGGALQIETRPREGHQVSTNGASHVGGYAQLIVRDSGCGMPPDTVKRLFEPFFTTKPEGTGLGLATVYGIVTQHDGAIQVDSTPGEGTEFQICLPMTKAEAAISVSNE